MLDRNTFLHFAIAFVAMALYALVTGIFTASIAVGSCLLTFEICQWIERKQINIKGSIWDLFTGLMGMLLAAFILSWIGWV